MNWLTLYINLLSVVAILVAPLAIYCTYRAWLFVRKYKGYNLPIIFFTVNLIACPIATLISMLALFRIRGGVAPDWVPLLTAPAFVILDIIPLITTGYMIWLDSLQSGRRSKPSE